PDSSVIRTREKLRDIGAVFVNLLIDGKYRLLQKPVVSAPGGYDLVSDHSIREILIQDITNAYLRAVGHIKNPRENGGGKRLAVDADKDKFIEHRVKNAVYKIFEADTGKRPYAEVFLTRENRQAVLNWADNLDV
ncbi:MAG: hypothetical protein LBB09_00510, partial [Rickettsiales bacterium]|nr:hypothetical protein [Rickettsiales bacterium]